MVREPSLAQRGCLLPTHFAPEDDPDDGRAGDARRAGAPGFASADGPAAAGGLGRAPGGPPMSVIVTAPITSAAVATVTSGQVLDRAPLPAGAAGWAGPAAACCNPASFISWSQWRQAVCGSSMCWPQRGHAFIRLGLGPRDPSGIGGNVRAGSHWPDLSTRYGHPRRRRMPKVTGRAQNRNLGGALRAGPAEVWQRPLPTGIF